MRTLNFLVIMLIFISCSSKNSVRDISDLAQEVDTTSVDASGSAIEKVYGKDYGDSLSDYYSIAKSDYLITLKTVGIYNEKWGENTQYTLTIAKDNKTCYEQIIDNLEAVTLTPDSRNCEVEIYNQYAFIVSVNGNAEKNISQKMYLRVIDLKSGETIKNIKIYEQNYGITNLRMILDSRSEKLLIAYTDISKENSMNLIYSVYSLKKYEFSIRPASVFLFDKSEKINPAFLKTKNKIYFFNESGKTYGAFGVTGEAALAFSVINKDDKPDGYTIIKDKGQMMYPYLVDHYLYYRLQGESQQIKSKRVEIDKL